MIRYQPPLSPILLLTLIVSCLPTLLAQDEFRFDVTGEACTTPDGRSGACTNIRSCEPLLSLLRSVRADPGAYSYLRESLCGYEGTDPVVCCPRSTDAGGGNFGNGYSILTIEDNCGVNNGSFTKRVVNGVPASLGQWPWIAALGFRSKRTPGKTLWQCGGALITARHVITAAHCVHGHEQELHLVRLGELDLERDDEGATPIDVRIEKLITHEEYSPVKHTNDIALIKMNKNVDFTTLIWPICLPATPELIANNFERNLPFIAGWGATSFRGPSASHLQEAQIPVVTNDQCVEAYSKFKSQVIDQRVLCAGYARGGKDACQGDSGGPLMWPSIPPSSSVIHYYLIGIVSYGYKCAEPGYPGVYTRVTEFIPWIAANLNS